MNFETVIGIEIHCELKTKTKMFSPAPNSYGQTPNSLVHPIDLGFPGVMPRVNKRAVELAILASTALNCTIDHELWFDRKNYFYPDLPKGYQITQSARPIGSNGTVEITVGNFTKKIHIERLHLEEDTAKQTHFQDYTLIDYNRCGVPLVEIVSDASIRSAAEAAAYVETLRLKLLYAGVSDVKMEEGSMRCDVNISLRPFGHPVYGTKVEIKNLNSVSNVEKAIQSEIERQSRIYMAGGQVEQETRRFDEATKQTVLMRKKTDAIDYKYFVEPNIVPIKLDPHWVSAVAHSLPEMPDVKRARYITEYGLSTIEADIILAKIDWMTYFEEAIRHPVSPKLICNWLLSDVASYLNKTNQSLTEIALTPSFLVELIDAIQTNVISSKQAKEVFEKVLAERVSPLTIVKKYGMQQVTDESAIRALVNTVLDENPQAIATYHSGRDNILGFLVGQVMKRSKGQANPALTSSLLKEELAKRPH